MPIDTNTNFSIATLAAGIDAVTTTITVNSGEGTRLKFPRNAVVWNNTDNPADPAGDTTVEIVRITNIVGDTLTVTRAQEGTSASTHNAGGKTYRIAQGVTSRDMDALGALMNSIFVITDPRYGALGDDVDDGAAIQLAFDACRTNGGGWVYAPSGTYKIVSGDTVDLSAFTSEQIKFSGVGYDTIFNIESALGFDWKLGSAFSGHEITSLQFRGTFSAGQTLIEFQNASAIHIHDCFFANAECWLEFINNIAHLHLHNCSFQSGTTAQTLIEGVRIRVGSLLQVVNNNFELANADSVAIKLTGTPTVFPKNLAINENNFTGSTFAACLKDTNGCKIQNLSFDGNRIEGPTQVVSLGTGIIDNVSLCNNKAIGDTTGKAFAISKNTIAGEISCHGNQLKDFTDEYDFGDIPLVHQIGYMKVKQKTLLVTLTTGLSAITVSNWYPAGTLVLGETVLVKATISGPTSVDVGDDDDPDLYVDATTKLTSGNIWNAHLDGATEWTGMKRYATTQSLKFASTGGNFGDETVRVCLHYLEYQPAVT